MPETVSPPAPAAPRTVRRRRSRRSALTNAGLLAGPVGWVLLFFLIPVVLIAAYSVGALVLLRSDQMLSLDSWRYFLGNPSLLGSPLGDGLFWKSLKLAVGVSVTCIVLAYPVAYLLALVAGRRKYTLLLLIITPFLISYLLRVLAWRVLLNPSGVIQQALRDVGLLGASDSVTWLFNSTFAVYLVLAYSWVPFVALPIFVSLDGIDRHMLEASSDLGASRWQTFRKVTLPMSMPGVIAGFVFVLIPTIGEYVTPQLVGGKGGYMFGNVIQSSFSQSLDWQLGAAMSVFLLATVAVLLLVFGRYLRAGSVSR